MDGVSLQDYLHVVKAGPGQYYQRERILEDAGTIVKRFGRKVLISGGKRALASITDRLHPSLQRAGIEYQINTFSGESSESNVQKVLDIASDYKPDFIIAAGGGKALDTAKIAADMLGKVIVTIPTIAGTCAASSPLCILYNNEGIWQRNYYPKTNPNMVLVDLDVFLHSPIEYLRSGMLDSLAKWYEGRLSLEGSLEDADMFDGMAIELAGFLSRNMMEKASSAMAAAKSTTLNQEFIDVVNMNVYLAGTIQAFGVKAVRNGIAHSVHNGLTVLKESHGLTHGEKVGYGMAVQLVLQQSSKEEFDKLMNFYKEVGMNPTFAGLNIVFSENNVKSVADKTIESSDMFRRPFDLITSEMVANAIKKLEKLVVG
jgi:glycerol dehydrogenase-like iron-containing ADH family enzyme